MLLAMGIGGAHGRQVRLDAPSLDPLADPRPELEEPLVLPVDRRLPAERIVATMPAALRELGDPSTVSVIVTLHEPLAPASRGLSRARREALRHARIAAVEHDFVEAAAGLGFRASGGLSYFAIVSGEIDPRRLELLAALPQVRAIQPDRPLRAARVEGAALINADDVRDGLGGNGNGVTLVVLDSGINASHPDLAGKVDMQRSHNGPVGQDAFGHGTQVAGIIAGDGGLAPQARLWDVKVIGSDGMTTTSILIDALNALMPDMASFRILVGAFADPNFRFSTACDSLDPASTQVVQAFRDAGKLLIGAVGDAGDTGAIGVPACLSQIRAAGAVYDANVGAVTFGGCTDGTTAPDKIACYSNSNALLDFWAPGHNARSPRASGGFDNTFGGTSAATAYAAGVAAQIWSLRPQTSLVALENALRNNGPNITDARNGVTRRRIDALAANNSLGPAQPTSTPPAPMPTATAPGPGPTATPTRTPTPPGPAPTATTPAASPPAAPSGLTAQALTHTAVLLQWTDGSNNEVDFQIQARSGGGAFQEVLVVAANTAFAAVVELAPGTSYDFRVRARNAAGSSAFSNLASAMTAAGPTACVPNATTACLLGGLFRITGEMNDFASPPATFQNQVMSFPGGRAESEQAVFFESFEVGNFEIGVKMVDACSLAPGHPLRFFWAFFGGLTNQRTDITVMDTVTGDSVVWTNPANQFPTTVSNTMAFPCANGAAPACVRDAETACLIGGRFMVTGTMRNAMEQVFVTRVIQFAQDRAETDQAAFFQSFNPGNFEVGVKMLDACPLPPGHPLRAYWIFYGGLTNAFTEVLAVHTPTGRVDLWRNPANTLPTSEGRTNRFPCSP